MKKSKIIFYIIAVIVIVVGSYFYAYVNRDVALYNDSVYTREQLVNGTVINNKEDYKYSFNCDKDNLTGIKVLFSKTGAAKGKISYILYDEKGNAVTDTETKKVSSFKEGKYTLLKFDRIKSSKGNDYTLEITCDNEAADSVVVMQEPINTLDTAPGICYVYTIWDLQTMIVVIIFMAFLITFAATLIKIFRK